MVFKLYHKWVFWFVCRLWRDTVAVFCSSLLWRLGLDPRNAFEAGPAQRGLCALSDVVLLFHTRQHPAGRPYCTSGAAEVKRLRICFRGLQGETGQNRWADSTSPLWKQTSGLCGISILTFTARLFIHRMLKRSIMRLLYVIVTVLQKLLRVCWSREKIKAIVGRIHLSRSRANWFLINTRGFCFGNPICYLLCVKIFL